MTNFKNEKLTEITNSAINGQNKQMTQQIDAYNSMYDVFADLKDYCIIYYPEKSLEMSLDICIIYHRIKFR